MSDPVARAFAGLDADRPMPSDVDARLEAMLVDRSWESAAVPLPAEVRERIADAIARPEDPMQDLIAGIDAPRELPAAARMRIEATLAHPVPARRFAQRVLAIAAVAVLIVASTFAIVRTGTQKSGGPNIVAGGPDGRTTVGGGSISGPSVPFELPPLVVPAFTNGGMVDQGFPTATDAGSAPPFTSYSAGSPMAAQPGSAGAPPQPQPQPQPRPAPVLPLLHLASVNGDADEATGFDAYVTLANSNGGVRGHRFDRRGGASAIATVNLSDDPLKDPPGPAFENFAAPTASLRATTYGFSSTAEHQAHVLATALFPADSPSKTAVIYTASSGPYATLFPDAIAAVLDARHITSVRVAVSTDRPVVLVPGDGAFLSLPPAEARAWSAAAKSDGYHPAAGIGAVGSLADESLATVLPDATFVASPYALPPAGTERDAMRRAHVPMNVRAVHGWVTAKMICYAIWLSGADTRTELESAIGRLHGFANGFAPPYETRAGSNVRAPDALLYRLRAGRFVEPASFVTDRFTG